MAKELRNDAMLEMYRRMVRIRKFDAKCRDLYQRGTMQGVLHLSIGQEAVSVGACFDLADEDYITTTHRGHGDIIAKGASMEKMMAELLMKDTGYCRAKAGSMHLMDAGLGILGANGIVGAGLPIATGAGLAIHMRRDDTVCVCFFGDGAVNMGLFHESLNLAAIWKLPVVYVCHNNAWAQSVPQKKSHAAPDVADRAKAYGIPGFTVDAVDLLAVYDVCSEAFARARRGEGPSLVNCETYRWYGHHIGDVDQPYRPKEELAYARSKDCIAHFRSHLVEHEIALADDLDEIDASVEGEVETAVEKVKDDPPPRIEDVMSDVYVGIDPQ